MSSPPFENRVSPEPEDNQNQPFAPPTPQLRGVGDPTTDAFIPAEPVDPGLPPELFKHAFVEKPVHVIHNTLDSSTVYVALSAILDSVMLILSRAETRTRSLRTNVTVNERWQ
jgi:hypothetical protein